MPPTQSPTRHTWGGEQEGLTAELGAMACLHMPSPRTHREEKRGWASPACSNKGGFGKGPRLSSPLCPVEGVEGTSLLLPWNFGEDWSLCGIMWHMQMASVYYLRGGGTCAWGTMGPPDLLCVPRKGAAGPSQSVLGSYLQ